MTASLATAFDKGLEDDADEATEARAAQATHAFKRPLLQVTNATAWVMVAAQQVQQKATYVLTLMGADWRRTMPIQPLRQRQSTRAVHSPRPGPLRRESSRCVQGLLSDHDCSKAPLQCW